MSVNLVPRISVLLPCRNCVETLPDALDSLVGQTETDFEVVAIDDGSIDETWTCLERARSSDARIRIFRRSHRGIAATLIEGSALARGAMLARMDSDDLSHPERFRQQLDYLDEHPDVSVVGSRVRLFPRDTLAEGSLRYESWLNGLLTHDEMMRDRFVESPLAHPSVMIRREVFDRLGGYRDLGWPEDYDLWLRLFEVGFRAHKLPETLIQWRDRPDRASRMDPAYREERFLDLKLHSLTSRLSNAAKGGISIWGAGAVGKRWARGLLERGHRVRYFVDLDARKIGKTIHGARVLSDADLAKLGDGLTLVAVGAMSRLRGIDGRSVYFSAREEIREQLTGRGFVEGRDFLCVA